MSAPAAVVELVDRFERNVEAYKRPDYNETQVRREFIELCWSTRNEIGELDA